MNLDYKYTVKSRKRMPTSARLSKEIVVKVTDFGSGSDGKRILVAGTAQTVPAHPFLAIFNTRYNITEFVWDESATIQETLRGIDIDLGNDQGAIFSRTSRSDRDI